MIVVHLGSRRAAQLTGSGGLSMSCAATGAPAASATAFMMASASGYSGYARALDRALWTGFKHSLNSATSIYGQATTPLQLVRHCQCPVGTRFMTPLLYAQHKSMHDTTITVDTLVHTS